MKGYKGRLNDTELWNIVNYLRSVGQKQTAAKESLVSAPGQVGCRFPSPHAPFSLKYEPTPLRRSRIPSRIAPPRMRTHPEEPGIIARLALALTAWTERWVPDAFIFALLATLLVVVAGVALTPSHAGAGHRRVGRAASGT